MPLHLSWLIFLQTFNDPIGQWLRSIQLICGGKGAIVVDILAHHHVAFERGIVTSEATEGHCALNAHAYHRVYIACVRLGVHWIVMHTVDRAARAWHTWILKAAMGALIGLRGADTSCASRDKSLMRIGSY